MSRPLLSIRGLSKTFPGLRALDEVALSVASGEIVAVVGQNGSGKSTLVKVLAGLHAADPGGEVALADHGSEAEAELHFIHQDLGLIEMLSTLENLNLERGRGWRSLAPTKQVGEAARAEELIGTFGASIDVRAPVRGLTAAERTIVAIARAFDGWTHPRNVLVLDEPTAALHGAEVEKLFEAVRLVAAQGAGVIFISHRLDEVVRLADRIVVLRDGCVVADVGRDRFDHDHLVALITGAQAPAARPRRTSGSDGADPAHAPGALTARGIRGTTIRDLDLHVDEGEIVGVSGVLGSGREQVAGILFGAAAGDVRELRVGRQALARRSPRAAISAGVAYVPADRRGRGAVLSLSARENITLPRLHPFRRLFGRLDQRLECVEVGEWIDRVQLSPPDPERPLTLLSGGNQQKAVLAKWLRNHPKLLLLDEPTQGVDVGAKARIVDLIADAAARGSGVLICSSDAKELSSVCDRVLVMRDGEAVAELAGSALTESRLVQEGLGLITDASRPAEELQRA